MGLDWPCEGLSFLTLFFLLQLLVISFSVLESNWVPFLFFIMYIGNWVLDFLPSFGIWEMISTDKPLWLDASSHVFFLQYLWIHFSSCNRLCSQMRVQDHHVSYFAFPPIPSSFRKKVRCTGIVTGVMAAENRVGAQNGASQVQKSVHYWAFMECFLMFLYWVWISI